MSDVSAIVTVPDTEPAKTEARFAFGKNWQRFLGYLDEERVGEAEKSLRTMLEVETLEGKSFLDVGSGSGLFSLAAMRLGARKVNSFDYDPVSVACTERLRRMHFPDAQNWTIERGSVLDESYLKRLGQFDVVYSWGVLHHTGDMWRALSNVIPLVRSKGTLFIAIYNDEGLRSRMWRRVKRLYAHWPVIRPLLAVFFFCYFALKGLVADTLVLRRNPLIRYKETKKSRGMAYPTEIIDWIGGYPFEVATPDEIFGFFKRRSFRLMNLKAKGRGHGNNEFVFEKCAE